MLPLATFALALASAPIGTVAAQDSAWAVVFVSASDSADEAAAGDALVRTVAEGLQGSGEVVIGQDDLAARIDRDSIPLRPAPRDVIARLEREAAIDAPLMASLSMRRNLVQVLAQIDALLELARPHLAALGRDDSTAELVSRVCLFGVRAELDQNHADDARRRLRECARLTPDLADPNDWRVTPTRWHPPPVVLEHLRLRESLRQGGTEIVVRGTAGSPPDCTVRLNGRAVGRTPEARVVVVPGEYALAVDCGDRAGRIRTVRVDQGATQRVIVPVVHDQVARTSPSLRLAFSDAATLDRDAATAIGGFGRAAGVTRILTVRDSGDGRTTVQAWLVAADGAARPSGSVDIADARSAVALRDALLTLTSGPRPDASSTGVGGSPVDAGPRSAPPRDEGSSILFPALLGAMGVGLLAWAAAHVLDGGRCTERSPTDICLEETRTNWTATAALGAAGLLAIGGATVWLILGTSSGASAETALGIRWEGAL